MGKEMIAGAALASFGVLCACTGLSTSDRALIAAASRDAADARTASQQALTAATNAQTSAAAAALVAQAANEKTNRISQRTSPK